MVGFVPYDEESDAIVDNWAGFLASGRSIFWEDMLKADLEGRRNFLNCGTERVPGRDRESPEDIRTEHRTSQEAATAAEQTLYLPSIPTVDEPTPPRASSHADDSMVMRELHALKQTMEKMSADNDRRFLQMESMIEKMAANQDRMESMIEKMAADQDRRSSLVNDRLGWLTNLVSSFVQQQPEPWSGGYQAESGGDGGSHGRGVDVSINAGGDNDARDEIFAPTDVGSGTERGVERVMEDSPLTDSFYHTPTCSSDKACEENTLDVGQQEGRPKRHLKKSKYMRTPYTDPIPKKMMFRKRSIKEFDPLRLPDGMRNSFEEYKKSVPKPAFTSDLGKTRPWDFFDQILTEHFWLLSDVSILY